MSSKIEKRIEALERKAEGPPRFVVRWSDEPADDDEKVIRLTWGDERDDESEPPPAA